MCWASRLNTAYLPVWLIPDWCDSSQVQWTYSGCWCQIKACSTAPNLILSQNQLMYTTQENKLCQIWQPYMSPQPSTCLLNIACKCIFEHGRLNLVSFGLLHYSLFFLIHFLHPFLSSLFLFSSSTPFIRVVLACHTAMDTVCVCVCVCARERNCVWKRQMKGACTLFNKWHSTYEQDIHSFSHISDNFTHTIIAPQFDLNK